MAEKSEESSGFFGTIFGGIWSFIKWVAWLIYAGTKLLVKYLIGFFIIVGVFMGGAWMLYHVALFVGAFVYNTYLHP